MFVYWKSDVISKVVPLDVSITGLSSVKDL